MEALQTWIAAYRYEGLFIFLMMGIVGVPLPEDLMLACAGYLIFKGYLAAWPTYGSAFLGSVCGITTSYLIGKYLGYPIVTEGGRRLGLTSDRLARVERWYSQFGKWSLTFGYYIGGVRHVNALVAGSMKLEFRSFALFAYPGAFLWTISIISAGYILGEKWSLVFGSPWSKAALGGAVVVGLAALYLAKGRTLNFRRSSLDRQETDTGAANAKTRSQDENSGNGVT